MMSKNAVGLSGAERVHILVVDDDHAMRELLRDALSEAGYDIHVASSRAELFLAVEDNNIDLITLDLNLDGEDGLEIAAEVRALSNVPIVMITGRAEPVDRVAGLESGADDYIAKPFHVREVQIRVKAVLDRYRRPLPNLLWTATENGVSDDTPSIRFDHCILDFRRRFARHIDGSPLDLTESEFDILALFLTNPGRILSRDEIWLSLRGNERNPLDRTLDGHIARLRAKIEEGARTPLLIKSIRGVGYVFVGEVGPAPVPANNAPIASPSSPSE